MNIFSINKKNKNLFKIIINVNQLRTIRDKQI